MYRYLALLTLIAALHVSPDLARAQGGHQGGPRAPQAASPYVGQEGRDIKALDPAEVKDLLEGRGLGLAKAAELNHYPGPAHVLQLARELALTAEQERATRALFEPMEREAIRLGRRIVEKERELDRAFAEGRIDGAGLEGLVSEIARLMGELRLVHLRTHLSMKELLTPEQVRRYDELRGYATPAGMASGEHGRGGAGRHGH